MTIKDLREAAVQIIEDSVGLIEPGYSHLFYAATNEILFAYNLKLISYSEKELYWKQAWEALGYTWSRKPGQAT